jgi:hypothetical protein
MITLRRFLHALRGCGGSESNCPPGFFAVNFRGVGCGTITLVSLDDGFAHEETFSDGYRFAEISGEQATLIPRRPS